MSINFRKLISILLLAATISFSMVPQASCVEVFRYDDAYGNSEAWSNIGYALGTGLARLGHGTKNWNTNRKLRRYIKSCNEPSLELLPPEEAMKIITKRGLVCKTKEETRVNKNKNRASKKKG